MGKAYLTIDDVTSNITPYIIDGLEKRNIKPVLFSTGANLLAYWEEGKYALKKGAIVGNHSYSHPYFSKLSLEECYLEILKQEELLDRLYNEAGVVRERKNFRFPYGDKGGLNKLKIQDFLIKLGFSKLDDRIINGEWYIENNHKNDIDVYWNFDFTEYLINDEKTYDINKCKKRLKNRDLIDGDYLLDEDSRGIILIHDHPRVQEIEKDYFFQLLDYAISEGINFLEPSFISFPN